MTMPFFAQKILFIHYAHEISTLTGAFFMVVEDVNRSPKFGGSREQASGD